MIKFLQHTVNTHTNEAQAGSKALNTACLRCAAVWVRPVQADGRPYSRKYHKSKQCTCVGPFLCRGTHCKVAFNDCDLIPQLCLYTAHARRVHLFKFELE